MIGVSQQYLGDQSSARRHIERALTHYLTSDHGSAVIRFVFDQRVTTRVFLARILWLQGFPDQAIRAAESGIEDAQRTNHAASLCYALALAACPIALLVGDLAAAERYVGMLLDHSTRHALAHWRAIGRRYQGVLVMKQGDAVTGSRLLSVGFDELDEATPVLGFVAFLKAEALGHAGQVSEGLAAVDELIARSEHTEERWLIAGLLRIRSELLLLEGAPEAAAAAEDHYHQGLDWARRQGALSLELRCTTSLARLWHGQARRKEAHELLAAVYERFTEGFATADLRAAKAQLGKLG
jgi:predicted ATPase